MLTEAPQIPRIKPDVTSHRFSPFPTQSHSSFFSLLPCLLFLFQFSLLNWAQSAEQQSLVELLWGSIARLLPRYKYSCCWYQNSSRSIYTCCKWLIIIYHYSSLVCHVWTQIHLSCCYCYSMYSYHCWTCCKYVRSNRDHSHNNTCIITKGTLRSSNAI